MFAKDKAVWLDRNGRQVGSRTSAGIGRRILVVNVTGQKIHDLQLVVLAEVLRIVEVLIVDTEPANEHHRIAFIDLVGTCTRPGVALCIVEHDGSVGRR